LPQFLDKLGKANRMHLCGCPLLHQFAFLATSVPVSYHLLVDDIMWPASLPTTPIFDLATVLALQDPEQGVQGNNATCMQLALVVHSNNLHAATAAESSKQGCECLPGCC